MTVFAILPSGGEVLVALLIGLLLFGGKLPEVAKDIGRTFFKLRRSVNDLRRETGIDETIRDLKREAENAKPVVDLNAPPYQPWPGDRREDAVETEEGAEAERNEGVADDRSDGSATSPAPVPEQPGEPANGGPADEDADGPVERTSSPARPRPGDAPKPPESSGS